MSVTTLPITREVAPTLGTELGLRPPHEWQAPDDFFTIVVTESGRAYFRADYRSRNAQGFDAWPVSNSTVGQPIAALADVLEQQLRTRHADYFDDIEAQDLLGRLRAFRPQYNWAALEDRADVAHRARRDLVATSPELRRLAFHGYRLYEAVFPPGSKLRAWMNALPPGGRLNLTWWHTTPGWVPDLPWVLMYQEALPPEGQPIDPLRFLGLRYRIEYSAYEPRADDPAAVTVALAGASNPKIGHGLYWDAPADDVTLIEAVWQRGLWASSPDHVCVPIVPMGPDPKSELTTFLRTPAPPPMPVLHLFCQCGLDRVRGQILYFGSKGQPKHTFQDVDLPQDALTDRPFVFINACATAAPSEAALANALEGSFFLRGCRAYLGTVARVPIRLASRFATIFFHFFCRRVDAGPIAAGEAAAQARLFLWTEYGNIGGLFYQYVNQYDLMLATEQEIRALARRP